MGLDSHRPGTVDYSGLRSVRRCAHRAGGVIAGPLGSERRVRMFSNLVNYALASGMAGILVAFCDVPIEDALIAGCLLGIFYTLADISSHLRKSK